MSEIFLTILVLIIWNIVVFGMYGMDKRKARHGKRRISENTLLTAAALMGGLGAMLGVFAIRHKTRHAKFTKGVPLLLLLNIAIVIAIAIFLNESIDLGELVGGLNG